MMKTFPKRLFGLVALVALVFGNVGFSFAQDLVDAGSSEPYHPGLVTYRVGLYHQQHGDHNQAIAEFTQTIDGLPNMGFAYAARGDSYAALGAYETAIADYSMAIRIYPDYVSALYTRGRAYAALGETELAADDYANAIRQMPDYPNPYWGLGDLLYETGAYTGALEQYQAYVIAEGAPVEIMQVRIAFLETMVAAGAL